MSFYDYSSSNKPASLHPIQLNSIGSNNSRPTIPYKQFRKPDSNTSEHSHLYYATTLQREEETSPLSGSRSAMPASLITTNMPADESSPVPSPIDGVSGHTRRRSTLTGLSVADLHRSSRDRNNPIAGPRPDSKHGSDNPSSDSTQSSDDEDLQNDEETALNDSDRKKRRKRKRRNTLLDQRFIPDAKISDQDKKEADQYVVKNLLINAALIGLWYIFSLSISIYNKWMFDPNHLDFKFPLCESIPPHFLPMDCANEGAVTTCMHMLVQFSLASITLFFFPQFRPRSDSISNPNNIHVSESERLRYEELNRKPLMTRWFYFTRLGPCGLATGLDIGLGNMSLKFITLTFYTMVKSSSLAFVLLFAFLFRLESLSLRLVAIIAVMTSGVILMVSGETAFNLLGFVLILSAAFFSGFRWALTQILLLRNPATSNPFASIFYLAPIMFLSLLLIALPVEGIGALSEGLHHLVAKRGIILGPAILLFPGCIAFLMTASEFALLQRTSVVTLSIAGIFKEVVTISAAALVFHDKMSPINISGLIVTISSIASYNYIKIRSMREKARMDVLVGKSEGAEYGVVADDESDSDDDGHHVTADGDILPLRPGHPQRLKSGRGVYG